MSTLKPINIIIVEDCLELAHVYQEYLHHTNYKVTHIDNGADTLAAIKKSLPDIVLLDLELGDMNGTEILEYINKEELPIPVVIMTAHGSVDTAVKAMQLGASDFLTKPFDAKRLLVTLQNALNQQNLQESLSSYRETFDRPRFAGFIGGSLLMQLVYRMIESCAPSSATVFITGESGTGKEICAQAIHHYSPRKEKPFIAINCAAIPDDLIESEIFGHIRGSFTGAVNDRQGAASLADGGTLFFDEICEMKMDLQSKILRFVQTGSFQKVGCGDIEKVDIRFICATNRNPLNEVEAGRFREDLYYRLHVIPIELPPLRDRENDILEIAQKFLIDFTKEENKKFNAFSSECQSIFLKYNWPGNVRELQNIIRNAVVLNNAFEMSAEMLPKSVVEKFNTMYGQSNLVRSATDNHDVADNTSSQVIPLWKIEKQTIEEAILFCGGNVPRAAALLEISPSTIYRKLDLWKRKDEAKLA
ncbi:MAG: sigma-54 dependent transcriptional regulator [Methylococcales bacterium]